MDFIPQVRETIEEFMRTLTLRRGLVREFIKQTNSVLEYDSNDYRKVSFLGEYNSIPIIVTVTLQPAFPNDAPLVTLQSMAHWSTKPLFRNLAKVPWSPRWTAEEMVKRIRYARCVRNNCPLLSQPLSALDQTLSCRSPLRLFKLVRRRGDIIQEEINMLIAKALLFFRQHAG